MDNKYGVKEVLELSVFDADGNLVTKLGSLTDSKVTVDTNNNKVIARDALLDVDLLRFQQNDNQETKTDYEMTIKELQRNPVVFNTNNKTRPCKLVAKTEMRKYQDEEDVEVYFDFPIAEIVSSFELDVSAYHIDKFDIVFNIKPDDSGDLFSIYGL